jgi:hypothetical protein
MNRRAHQAYHNHVSRIRSSDLLRNVTTAQYHITMQRPPRQTSLTTRVSPLPSSRARHFRHERRLDINERIALVTRALQHEFFREETIPCATDADLEIHTSRMLYNCTNSDILGDTCTICLQQFCNTDSISILGCSHGFHTPCIERWLKTQRANCALCRKSLFS